MSLMQQPRIFGRAIYKQQSDDFARQRSRYVDEFSKVELRLSQLYIKLGLTKIESSFGQKVGELNSLRPSPGLSKATASQIRSISADLSRHIKMRNGIVHATMTVGTKSSEDVAFFQKISDAAAANPIYFVMSFDDFANAIEAMQDLSERLDQMAK
jgi:hypothetical protein